MLYRLLQRVVLFKVCGCGYGAHGPYGLDGAYGVYGTHGPYGLTGLMGRTDYARIVFAAAGMLGSATKRNKKHEVFA